jgi:peptidoglycan/LPS O-acetylase OafA/YrhL
VTGTPARAGRHVAALDVLRGIAAMVVLIGHCTLVYGLPLEVRRVADIVLNQRAAVLIFFVLSGYVLTYAWLRLRDEPRAYFRFYLRRFFRLMPALWAATALALILLLAFPLDPAAGRYSEWMHHSYQQVGAGRAMRSFMGIDNAVVPPTWTITVEILGSIMMPLLVGILSRRAAIVWVFIAVLVLVSLTVAEWYSRASFLAFVLQFACGVALALSLETRVVRRRKALAAAGLVLLFASRPLLWVLITGDLQPIEYRVNAALPALFETVGAVLLIAALASGEADRTLLASRPMRALGHWSYGIYLIHFPVLRMVAYALPPMAPLAATLILALVTITVTCVLAMLLFKYVEAPGIALGKRLSARPGGDALGTRSLGSPS